MLAAIECGEVTLAEAWRQYGISEEEFLAWKRAYRNYGLSGLRATRSRMRGARGRGRKPKR